jgi:hypothetical protein
MSWFLAAALRWTHERIQQHSSLFHLAGWGLPAAQTIAVLVLQDVDADELTGKDLRQILTVSEHWIVSVNWSRTLLKLSFPKH